MAYPIWKIEEMYRAGPVESAMPTYLYEKSQTTQKTEYEIKRGEVEIESSDAEKDYEAIKKKVEEFDGWTDSINKYETDKTITISATFKIPSERLEEFSNLLLNNFKIKNTRFYFYRVSVERQKEEIEILLTALEAYDRLLKRAEASSINETVINTIFLITEKKLEVMRLLKMYGYSIQEVEKRANYSEVLVSIYQEKPIKILPENKGRDFEIKLRDSVNEIINAGMDLLTVPFVILVKVIVFIIYAIIALIPIFVAYKFVVKIYKWINRKAK